MSLLFNFKTRTLIITYFVSHPTAPDPAPSTKIITDLNYKCVYVFSFLCNPNSAVFLFGFNVYKRHQAIYNSLVITFYIILTG